MSLPRGPVESVQSWYAGSRLAIYILTVIVWGASGPPRCHLFVSRCKEKSPPYSLYVWRHLLREILDLTNVEKIEWWSDGGKHFRGQVPIASMVMNGIDELCKRSSLIANFEVGINFGVSAHFKNACDGAQAHAKAALAEMSKKTVISTLSQYVERAQKLYADFQERPGATSRMPAKFHLLWPREQKAKFVADYCRQFTAASYKEQIGVCQSWLGRLNGTRRIPNPLYENKNRQLTGIRFTALMLASQRATSELSCLPVVCPVAAPAVDEVDVDCDAEAEVLAEAAELCPAGDIVVPVGEKMMDGWMFSYRKNEPELAPFSKWRSRFTKHREKWQRSGIALQMPQARRPVADQLALQRAWRDRRLAAKAAR